MVNVYFETENGSFSEFVASFDSEELFIKCLPALEIEAKLSRMIVTESIMEA
jgi:hypothetical protein